MSINKSMFESIRDSLDSSSNSGPKDFLRTEVGNTYTVRLLPFAKDPKKTFYHYFQHGWNSFTTGQYVQAVSPTTWGERDPIAETRYKFYRGPDEEKELTKQILRLEKWLVNVFIVNDPVTPENNGKVMILRYGKQLHKIIASAIEGDDADELGPRVFDLGPDGVNLKIIVEKQGDYPTYVSSKFSFPSAIDGLDESKQEEIYNSVYDLTDVLSVKSYDELKQMVDEHIFGEERGSKPAPRPVKEPEIVPEPAAPQTPVVEKTEEQPAVDDEEIKKLLGGLDLS